MKYIVIGFLIIIVSQIIYILFTEARETRMLQNKKLTEGKYTGWLIKNLRPKNNSKQYRKLADTLFFLDYNMTVDTFYFWKIICCAVLSIVVLSISLTNAFANINEVYTTPCKIGNNVSPIVISSKEYKTLTRDVSFKAEEAEDKESFKAFEKKDIEQVSQNVISLSSDKFRGIASDDIYQTVKSMHNKLESVFGFSTLFMVFLCCLFMYFVPDIGLMFFRIYLTNEFIFEFVKLETLILLKISSFYKMEKLIESLISNSLVYRELLRNFYRLYEVDHELAYAFCHDLNRDLRRISPEATRFLSLVTYLSMLETDGDKIVKDKIRSSREFELEIINDYKRRKARRIKMGLFYLLFFCVMLDIVLSVVPIIPMLMRVGSI